MNLELETELANQRLLRELLLELPGNRERRMKMKNIYPTEHFLHDDCPKCGTPSVPVEKVPDQALRGCPECLETWVEDLTKPPKRSAQPRAKLDCLTVC